MKAQTFNELFDQLPTLPGVGKDAFVKQAEVISTNSRHTIVLSLLLVCAMFSFVVLIQYLQIRNLNQNQKEKIVLMNPPLLQQPDSAVFPCVHCGWPNQLLLKNKTP